jgi:N-acetylneuraminic acid mutarotase
MVRESRSRLRRAAGNLHSLLLRARDVWPVPVLAITAAALLAAAQAQPAPTLPLAKGALAQGSWTMLAPMLHSQNEAVTVVIGERIYVMGGFTTGTNGPIDRVQIYDVAKNAWSEGTPLPEPVHHHGAALVGGKIYLVGGFHEPFQTREPIDSTWVFDPATNHWDRRAPLPSRRGALVVGAIGNLVYAAGGEHRRPAGTPVPQGAPPAYEPVTDFTVYDPQADRWSQLPAMKVARDHAFVGVINGRLYVVGGRDRPKYDIVTVEEFDPGAGAWTERAPMPTGRSGGHATVLGGRLYVFGGEGNNASPVGLFNEVEAFDPAANSWTRFEPMPLPRHSLVTATLGNRIYLPGGATTRGGTDITAYVDAFEPVK